MFRGRQFQHRNPMLTLLAQRYQTVSHFSRPIRVSNKPRFLQNIFDFMRPGTPLIPLSHQLVVCRCRLQTVTRKPSGIHLRVGGQKSYHRPISILPFPSSTTSCLMNWTDLYNSYAYKSFVDYYIYSSNI